MLVAETQEPGELVIAPSRREGHMKTIRILGASVGSFLAAGMLLAAGVAARAADDPTNRATFAPCTNGGKNEDVTATVRGPILGAKTWKMTKPGAPINAWNGWEGTYNGTFNAAKGEYWTISGYYKTTAPANVGSLGVYCIYKPDWSKCFDSTVVDSRLSIIPDGNWHFFYATIRANEAITNGIILDGPSWGYSTAAGELYLHALQWTRTRYVVPYPNQKNYANTDPYSIGGGLISDVTSTEPGPVPGSRTWRFEKTGSSSQWQGWSGALPAPLTAGKGESWTFSGYYKTSNSAGQASLQGMAFADGNGYQIFAITTDSNMAIIQDGEWHYFHFTMRSDTGISAPRLYGPIWSSSTSAGVLYVNGLRWTRDGGLPTCTSASPSTSYVSNYYGNSLSAVVGLQILDPSKVVGFQVVVKGQNGGKDFVRAYYPADAAERARLDTSEVPVAGFHVPVIGLYAPTSVADVPHYSDVRILLDTADQGCFESTLRIGASLPTLGQSQYMPVVQTTIEAPDRMEPGWTFAQLAVDYANKGPTSWTRFFGYDEQGAIRWEMSFPNLFNPLIRTRNGTFLLGTGSQLEELSDFGKTLRVMNITDASGKTDEYWMHHETLPLPNGHVLLSASISGGATIFDQILELDDSGKIVWNMDLGKVFDPNRTTWLDANDPKRQWTDPKDWLHNNGLAYSAKDDTIIASGRFQGVAKLDRSGKLIWMLAPHRGWNNPQKEKLLTAVDANGNPYSADVQDGGAVASDGTFDWTWGQHSPTLLPNGDILVFDNGDSRQFIGGWTYSRAVIYRVDETNKTVRQIWHYDLARGQSSAYVSNTYQLPTTGNILIQSGVAPLYTDSNGNTTGPYCHVKEVAPDGSLVFESSFITGRYPVTTGDPVWSYSYRGYRYAF
jgi:hypothetical protein